MPTRILLGGALVALLAVLIAAATLELPYSGTSSSAFSNEISAASSSQFTLADVAQHAGASSCWSAIDGDVYDLTQWIGQHPGGASAILSICGTDGSAAFNVQHGGQARPERELAHYKIGTLAS